MRVMQESEQQDTAVAGASTLRREVAIAAGSVGFGLIVLPFAVYLVGQRLLVQLVRFARRIWRPRL